MSEPAIDKVAERWQDETFTKDLASAFWMSSPVVGAYLNRLASGDRRVDWLTHLAGRCLTARSYRVLVLGCGEGWLERSIAPAWYVESIDAVDVAAGAVERARAEAERLGLGKIRYHVRDLNREDLPPGPYELILAHSVIHHVENLDRVFEGMKCELADDGVLLVNEYVGPKRFQFTDLQLDLMNELLAGWPERYRRGRLWPGTYERKVRPTVEEMIANDPSEAVRSDEIETYLRRHFEVALELDYGGTLLHHLLYDVIPNFHPEEPNERAAMEAMCRVEEQLIAAARLPADFKLYVAAKRPLEVKPPDQPPVRPRPLPQLWIERVAEVIPQRSPVEFVLLDSSAPLREAANRAATGRADCDWVSAALAGLPPNEPAGRFGLPSVPAPWTSQTVRSDAAPSGGFSCVVASGELSLDELERLAGCLRADGRLVARLLVEPEPLSAAMRELLAAFVESGPPARRRDLTPWQRGRRRRQRSAEAPLAPIKRWFSERFEQVALRPLASALLDELDLWWDLASEPTDDAERLWLGTLAAADRVLLRTELVAPTVVLIEAKQPRR